MSRVINYKYGKYLGNILGYMMISYYHVSSFTKIDNVY